jgi:hypothetical protein
MPSSYHSCKWLNYITIQISITLFYPIRSTIDQHSSQCTQILPTVSAKPVARDRVTWQHHVLHVHRITVELSEAQRSDLRHESYSLWLFGTSLDILISGKDCTLSACHCVLRWRLSIEKSALDWRFRLVSQLDGSGSEEKLWTMTGRIGSAQGMARIARSS